MENPLKDTTSVLEIVESITPLLWMAMLLAFCVWIIFSSVLVYHWVQYGYKSFSVTFVVIMYFSGSALLLSSALVALFLI